MRRILLILCLFCFLSAHGADAIAKPISPPDPINLESNWWQYFDQTDTLAKTSDAFIASLKSSADKLSPDNQKAALETIDKIQKALGAYNTAINTPLPQKPTPTPINDTYTIDSVIEIHRDILKQVVESDSIRIQQEEEMRQQSSIQQQLSSLKSKYENAAARSEEKILTGLNLILYNITLRVTNKQLEVLKATAFVNSEILKNLQDEILDAEERMVSSSQEQSVFEKQARIAKKHWEHAQEALQKTQATALTTITTALEREDEIKSQLHVAANMEATVKEAIAHNKFLFATLKFNLSRILNEPEKIDISTLRAQVDEWEQTLNRLDQNERDWEMRTTQTLQQYSHLLSLSAEDIRGVEGLLRQVISKTQNNLLLEQQLNNELDDSLFAIGLLDTRVTSMMSTFGLWAGKVSHLASRSFTAVNDFFTFSLIEISPNQFITIGSILRFLLVIVFAIWAAYFAKHALRKLTSGRKGIHSSLVYRVTRLIQYLIFAIGLLIGFSILGFDFSSLLLIIGALGVGLGFGMQSIFNNFLSGIIILFESQLKVGDYVELEATGLRGEIKEIHVRNTIIMTNDGADILVPNSELINNRIINWTLHEPYRRIHVPFSAAYGSDKELIKRLVIDVAKNVKKTLSLPGIPEPKVYLTKFGDSALEFELVVWVNEISTRRQSNTQSAYLWAIETIFKENGIEIPFPQREVRFRE